MVLNVFSNLILYTDIILTVQPQIASNAFIKLNLLSSLFVKHDT